MLFHIDEQFRITLTGEKCKKNLPPPKKNNLISCWLMLMSTMLLFWHHVLVPHSAHENQQELHHYCAANRGSHISPWLFERDRSHQSQSFSMAACYTTGHSGGTVHFSDCWGGNRSKEVQNSNGVWLIWDSCDWHVSSGRRERVDTISRTMRWGALKQRLYMPNKTR